MREGEVSVNFDHHILSINGIRSEVPEKRAFHQMEIFFGEFSTDIEIPVAIDTAQIQAEYQDGFLRVFLPKEKPKKIHVKED
jgi:HSP20 family protein